MKRNFMNFTEKNLTIHTHIHFSCRFFLSNVSMVMLDDERVGMIVLIQIAIIPTRVVHQTLCLVSDRSPLD